MWGRREEAEDPVLDDVLDRGRCRIPGTVGCRAADRVVASRRGIDRATAGAGHTGRVVAGIRTCRHAGLVEDDRGRAQARIQIRVGLVDLGGRADDRTLLVSFSIDTRGVERMLAIGRHARERASHVGQAPECRRGGRRVELAARLGNRAVRVGRRDAHHDRAHVPAVRAVGSGGRDRDRRQRRLATGFVRADVCARTLRPADAALVVAGSEGVVRGIDCRAGRVECQGRRQARGADRQSLELRVVSRRDTGHGPMS